VSLRGQFFMFSELNRGHL